MNDSDETSLRELLSAELRVGEDRAPRFDALWSAAVARHHRARTRSIFAGVGALAALVALAFAFFATHTHQAAKSPRSTAATELPWRSTVLLTEWHAPTDALLPAAELYAVHN